MSQTALASLENAIQDNQFFKAKFLGHHRLKTFPDTLKAVMSKILSVNRNDTAVILDELQNAHTFHSNLIYQVAMQMNAFPLIHNIFSTSEDLESAVVPGQGLVIVEAIMRLNASKKARQIFTCFGVWSTIRIIRAFVELT